ncbi:LysE family translocator [Kiloniella laminariae]|uniref:LysE family translocator n=1 Tax=Kiloniella laminariae TaxID=454162 RepID=A0ABT4LEJ1_9PROT|nr:LysE family translocator [Kiloniella laminariae]MCZ4279513.1 LysE family translocator [Kiloniella laminariae]
MSIEFLLTSLVIILIPGTGAVYTIATGLVAGRVSSTFAAFGCTLSIAPHVIAAIFGLAAILHTSAILFQGIKIFGVIYLLYLAYQALKSRGPLKIDNTDNLPVNKISIVKSGILINVLNPKLSIFFLAFLPQFVDPASPTWAAETLLLGGSFMAMTFVVFSIYGVCASALRKAVLGSDIFMRWFRRTTAAAFAGFGLKLAFSEQ